MVRYIPSSFKVNVVTRPRQILVIEVAALVAKYGLNK
jgi:hypothetical protein